ncbi:transcription factor HES-4-like isoform X2 [Dreissena polymorpha]|uniref:transcription factor HES-4-like isoform X2 n=1 Tax=Dreissena polymorpha TaxID=45954 RepID=UPI002265389C|nr:transcription factor HES-4-like isoform X2 [Dreissena polymorpha]
MAPTTVADSTKDVETKKASQRKTNKPLIEKRRRARINDCLTQLKTIVLGSSEQQAGRTSKLEKADILEMTVEFVKSRLNKATGSEEPIPLKGDTSIKWDATYVAGYSDCLHEISRFL